LGRAQRGNAPTQIDIRDKTLYVFRTKWKSDTDKKAGVAVGKKVGGFLYLHRNAVGHADRTLLDALRVAEAAAGDFEWNVAKLSKGRVSLLTYEDFDAHAFPALLHAVAVDLASGQAAATDYSGRDNPPILHRKELLIAPDDPRMPAFRAVTRKAEEHGLFADPKAIGTRRAWEAKVSAAGLKISGPSLLDERSETISVARDKTAISRPGLSAPMAVMLRTGIVRKDFTVFDYGCGRGRDVEILGENGFNAFGWDPAHRPGGPRKAADVVNLGFVVNVIENKYEREETLKAAWSFATRVLVVSAMLVHKADVRGQTPHGDGFITSWSTFQKYFTQDELLSWVSETVGHRAVSLGQGIVGVFRDEDLEQEAFFSQRSRAAAIAERLRIPRRERATRLQRPGFAERISAELETLWQLSVELARMPAELEVPAHVSTSLAKKHASFKRVIAALEETYDLGGLEAVAAARRDDLLVFGALSLFPGSPRFSKLPQRMQRDVRHFFGSHSKFVAESTMLLMKLREPKAVYEALEASAATGSATLSNGILSFQTNKVDELDPLVRIMVGCGSIVSPGLLETDVVEIGPAISRIRGYSCENYTSAIPLVAMTIFVDLAIPFAKVTKQDGLVLYGKSRFMHRDDPGLGKQLQLERLLKKAKVVDEKNLGPSAKTLSGLLSRKKMFSTDRS
jgi:DNA phosphorothioation-associated putative methyltransferase